MEWTTLRTNSKLPCVLSTAILRLTWCVKREICHNLGRINFALAEIPPTLSAKFLMSSHSRDEFGCVDYREQNFNRLQLPQSRDLWHGGMAADPSNCCSDADQQRGIHSMNNHEALSHTHMNFRVCRSAHIVWILLPLAFHMFLWVWDVWSARDSGEA